MSKPKPYALLHDGIGGYYIKLPDGTETRWIPDLCDELNRLHSDLELEKENGKEWEGVVREAYAKRDEALIERRRFIEKLDEYRSQLNAEFRVTPRASIKRTKKEPHV